MSALVALNRAREAWERVNMQTSLDLWPDADALDEPAHSDPGASPRAGSSSARAFTPGAEPGRASPPRDGQPPVRDTAAPTGASAPSTPAEEAAVHAAPTTEASRAIRESSASAGNPLAPNGPGRNTPKVSRGQGRKGA